MKRMMATWGCTLLMAGCYPAQQQVFNPPPPPNYRIQTAAANPAGAPAGAQAVWQQNDRTPSWPPGSPNANGWAANQKPAPTTTAASGNWRSAGASAPERTAAVSPYQQSTASVRPVVAPVTPATPTSSLVVRADLNEPPVSVRTPVQSSAGSLSMADLVPPPDGKSFPGGNVRTTVPATPPTAESPTRPIENLLPPPNDPVVVKTAQPTVGKPAEPVVAKPVDTVATKPTTLAAKPAEVVAAKPDTSTGDKPSEVVKAKSVELTKSKPVGESVEMAVAKPAEAAGAKALQLVSSQQAGPSIGATRETTPDSLKPCETLSSCPTAAAAAGPSLTTPAVAGTSSIQPVKHRPAPAVRMVNSKRIQFDYEVKGVGPSGVGGVELWYTVDGRAWHKFDTSEQSGPPAYAEVSEEGTYGFTLLAKSGTGVSKQPPSSGDLPQVWVEVDLTAPKVQLLDVKPSTNAQGNQLHVTWTAADRNLARKPITLSYAAKASGPWTVVAANLDNTGSYTWSLPASLPGKVLLRVEAIDLVGNVGHAQSREPVVYDMAQPSVSIVDVVGK